MGAFDASTSARAGARLRTSARQALWLLQRDHRWLLDQLMRVEAVDDDPDLAGRVRIVCRELAAHSALEHRLFYPALDATLSDIYAVRTAHVEHDLIDEMADRLLCRDPGDPLFRPLVRVLRTTLRGHVAAEEAWFVEAREADIDWSALTAALQAIQHDRMRLPPPLTGGEGRRALPDSPG